MNSMNWSGVKLICKYLHKVSEFSFFIIFEELKSYQIKNSCFKSNILIFLNIIFGNYKLASLRSNLIIIRS